MIPVTKPFLPPIEDYQYYLKRIWSENWLTNDGPLVRELEAGLRDYLGVKHLVLVSNGTIALQFAIKSLDLQGEIITTPFTHIATTTSIIWENCTPVYVDIDSRSFNLNPDLIESAITDKTTAILATHVFGNPCNIERIQEIANQYKLKVIYDAAHCFAVRYRGSSVLNYGDLSTISFHATKLFHSTEGGAIITDDSKLAQRFRFLRNFGHDGPGKFSGVGINGKVSELHAAMGLANLKYVNEIRRKRYSDHKIYNELLQGLGLQQPEIGNESDYNCSYYPVVFKSEEMCVQVMEMLESENICVRRYFFPTLGCLDFVLKQSTPVAEYISQRVLCLPIFFELSRADIELICSIIHKAHK